MVATRDPSRQTMEEAPLLHKVVPLEKPIRKLIQEPGRRWSPMWGSGGGKGFLPTTSPKAFVSRAPPALGPDADASGDSCDHEMQGLCTQERRGLCDVASKASDGIDLDSMSTATGKSKVHVAQAFECRGVPWQRESKWFYVWILPISLLLLGLSVGPAYYVFYQMYKHWTVKTWGTILRVFPMPVAIVCFSCALVGVAVPYVYHFFRLRGSELVPEMVHDSKPLTHVVIVCSYKEPLDVLTRTFDSIAGQRGLRSPPVAVFAAEARDPTWPDAFAHLEQVCQGRLSQLIASEHVLDEGEAVGKSSNENFAARKVFRTLISEQGKDPFEVMVTIVDADSILSPTYLAHVEAAFWQQPDGRRLVYNGPLNVYRNFAQAGLLVQSLELGRCHSDTFHSPFQVPYPFSNYSLTLGFASEIGYWTPDVMPEDIHTVNKAMVNSFGSRTTVTIPAIICNDLVPDLADRYMQAKRHQWGSVTELAWTATLFQRMGLKFQPWWTVFTSEATRAGSFIGAVTCFALFAIETPMIAWLGWNVELMPHYVRFLLGLMGLLVVWQWLLFWVAEITLWQTLLKQFPIERPSLCRWLLLVLTMPVLHTANRLLFLVTPTLHAMFLAVFVGDLEYVCAPKGAAVRSRPLEDTSL